METKDKYYDTLGTVSEAYIGGTLVSRSSAGDISGNEISFSEHALLIEEAEKSQLERTEKMRAESIAAGAEVERVRGTGLQKFADEAAEVGFSEESIAALTGKKPKKKK